MNSLIDTVNLWADQALRFAWPMLWQSSLLIGVVLALDLLLRRKLRAAVRYALWLVVLVKLVLPPSLAVPTSLGWWLRPAKAAPAQPRPVSVVVTYGADELLAAPAKAAPVLAAPPPAHLSRAAWTFVGMGVVSLGLLAWMLVRWRQVAGHARRAAAAPASLSELLPKLPGRIPLRLTDRPQSPAVCGLFRPVMLLPRSLAEQLPPAQLRAVLLHELFHLRRGDVWVNCAQALLQIVYWWHPLLWLANARIRRVREEAVDDAVMLALKDEAETYVPTLLEVAKLALPRPLASLGLVGILESRSSLRQRIERLMDFHPPRKAGLTLGSAFTVLAFAALAVPMGEAPATNEVPQATGSQAATNSSASNGPSSAMSLDQRIKASTLSYDGKLLYEKGSLDEAQAKLAEALRADPQNQDAAYYLKLVREARLKGTGDQRKALPTPEADARTNQVPWMNTKRKLESIRLDSVSFDGTPLSEVLRSLTDESRKRDPEMVGVNFIIRPAEEMLEIHFINQPAEGRSAPPQPALEPVAGLSKPAATNELVDVSSVPITIKPPLTNVRLEDVLDAIMKGASRPLKCSIDANVVRFSARTGHEPSPLYVRTFKVDPNRLLESLHIPTGYSGKLIDDGEKKRRETVTAALRDHFTKLGVHLDPTRNPGKAIFFNDRQGMLIVRATLQDLDLIEAVISGVNTAPPQINIKARFVEVSQNDIKALGFDWSLGSVMTNDGSSGGQIGTAPVFNGVRSATNPLGAFPGNPSAGTNDQLFPMTGILTATQFRVVLKALQQRDGTELVAQPEVTITSGRQAQCKAVDVRSVVEGIDKRALAPPGITTTNDDESAVYVTEPLEFGPTLDISPAVLPDGYTINMSLVATVLEFHGYEDSRTNSVTVYVNGKRKQVSPRQPVFRMCQVVSQANVWDGQTLVLGGMMSDPTAASTNHVSMLAGLPLVGGLFRSDSENTHNRHLLVFITPTIIDPAGNRVHSGEAMPFAREAIPAQPQH